MAEPGTVGAFAVGLFPEGSAPARFAQLLAEAIPGWRIEPPEGDAVDLHVTATDPSGSRRTVSITVERPCEPAVFRRPRLLPALTRLALTAGRDPHVCMHTN